GVNTLEQFRRKTLFDQFAENRNRLTLRADHSDISGACLHGPAQHTHVISMPAGNDHDVGSLTRVKFRHGLFKVFRDHLSGFGKALTAGVSFPVVNDGYIKAGASRNLVEIYGDVTCAENIK